MVERGAPDGDEADQQDDAGQRDPVPPPASTDGIARACDRGEAQRHHTHNERQLHVPALVIPPLLSGHPPADRRPEVLQVELFIDPQRQKQYNQAPPERRPRLLREPDAVAALAPGRPRAQPRRGEIRHHGRPSQHGGIADAWPPCAGGEAREWCDPFVHDDLKAALILQKPDARSNQRYAVSGSQYCRSGACNATKKEG